MPPTTTKSDPVRRAARTLFQIGTVTAFIQLWNLFSARPLTADQTSAITVVGTLLVTFAQNALEEAGAVPEMLKGKPSAVPVTAPNDYRFDALAAAIDAQHVVIERLENALLTRGDYGGLHTTGFQVPAPPILTEQDAFIERFRG